MSGAVAGRAAPTGLRRAALLHKVRSTLRRILFAVVLSQRTGEIKMSREGEVHTRKEGWRDPTLVASLAAQP